MTTMCTGFGSPFSIPVSDGSLASCTDQYIPVNGDSYTLTLPSNLSPGGYLIRHEVSPGTMPPCVEAYSLTHSLQIIALHLAVTMGGAEFYPSCTQIQVGGNGNGQPNQTVHFPGAYSDSDPGIFDPTVSSILRLFCLCSTLNHRNV